MAAKDRIGKASEAVLGSEYLKRLMEDEQLRENILAAYGAARSAYGRVSNGKPAGKALMEDRKLQRELAEAASALKEASYAFRAPVVAFFCCWSARCWHLRSAKACAQRCSTCCSEPRRSSITAPRRCRPRKLPRRPTCPPRERDGIRTGGARGAGYIGDPLAFG